MKILHRDIKPSNLVFDNKGYLNLIDFGISKKIKKGIPILSSSGTIGYSAPEVIKKKPQNFCSDFFSMGVTCYELIFNQKPFRGENSREILEDILTQNIKIKYMDIAYGFSETIIDFVQRLLKRKQKERLGYNGIDEIKNHKWLKDVNWELMKNKNIEKEKIPFTPSIDDNSPYEYLDRSNNNLHLNLARYNEYLKKINDSKIFNHFYFNYYSFNINENQTKHFKLKQNSTNNNDKNTNTTIINITSSINNDEKKIFENNNKIIVA